MKKLLAVAALMFATSACATSEFPEMLDGGGPLHGAKSEGTVVPSSSFTPTSFPEMLDGGGPLYGAVESKEGAPFVVPEWDMNDGGGPLYGSR